MGEMWLWQWADFKHHNFQDSNTITLNSTDWDLTALWKLRGKSAGGQDLGCLIIREGQTVAYPQQEPS